MTGMDAVELPWPLVDTMRMLEEVAAREGRTPSSFEITFGVVALDRLSEDRDLLRTITSISRFDGCDVSFPERPGERPDCVEVRLYAEDWRYQHGIDVVVLLAAERL